MISSLNKALPKQLLAPGDRDEMTAESNSLDVQVSSLDSEELLEGILYVRKGRSSGLVSWSWKRRLVIFRFEDGGSILAYKASEQIAPEFVDQKSNTVIHSVYSNFHRRHPHRDFSHFSEGPEIDITSDLPWIAKDVENDHCSFVVEISTDKESLSIDNDESVDSGDALGILTSSQTRSHIEEDYESGDDGDDDCRTIDYRNGEGSVDEKMTVSTKQEDLMEELNIAKKKGKPLRIYFWCNGGTKEKDLWLKAFSRFGRLSGDIRRRRSLFSSFATNVLLGPGRMRSIAHEHNSTKSEQRTVTFAQEIITSTTLERIPETSTHVGKVATKDKEFRILPTYAYPHCSLTKSEMREEMLLPSDHFHDLRIPGCKDKEIGTLDVEVLQCIGLPRLDRGSDTDAVVYFVCGSYAFSSDIIYNRANPMWLRKTRRACTFPLFHGYARLYVGVFDNERSVKDDFAGRVVIDLARLRPRSTYDVTLPLRLSTHVYSRRRRGAIRLRFTLNWTTERDALLSYLPKSLNIPLPQHSKPNFETTVMCCDQKAFRNIAITVHGAHLPRRFTFNQMRAAIREINYTRKYIFTVMRQTVRETMQWKNPAISCFVFIAWMHCVFANAFSLVPFYLVVLFLLFLMRNYAKYCTDAPSQRGFIPPSWEELFFALVRGNEPDSHHIEPLELGIRQPSLDRKKSPESNSSVDGSRSHFRIETHKQRGIKLLQALSFLPDANKNPNDDHVEFPFADGKDYPKFTVKECLVTHGRQSSVAVVGSSDLIDCASTIGSGVSDDANRGVIPRFPLDMDLQRLMRKDSSGTKDYDEEENNFNASRAVMSQGMLRI
jgi:C2 domain